jgi:sulfur-oxidizing protein SoxA
MTSLSLSARPRESGDPGLHGRILDSRLRGNERSRGANRRVFGLAASIASAFAIIGAAYPATAEIPLTERKSGYDFMARETRAMQDDDTANPGMLWVLDGEALWNREAGAAAKSCAGCHGDARTSMKGIAARYPAYSPALGRPVNLEQRINMCRADRQQAKPFAHESKDLLALTAFVGRQSRGEPIAVADDEQTRKFIENGRAAFMRRQGQLNLSCAQCHDDNWSGRLAGSPLTQGQPTGYPIYRLEWQNVGSLQRRLRNCLVGMRAQPYDYGAPELVELELYLMERARGLPLESPGVRP